jgi:2-polyprenyl-3-methyl-5-hydroxy-6-metoxy-1,4-benzoquinol methylase
MAISDENHVDGYKTIHTEKYFSSGTSKHVDHLFYYISQIKPGSVLDFGCGRGDFLRGLSAKLPIEALFYDPAVSEYESLPAKTVDLVTCLDVMEHIPVDDVPDVIEKIRSLAPVALFVISNRLAHQILPNGENAHCTVRPPEWWRTLLEGHYKKVFGLPWRGKKTSCFLCTMNPNQTIRISFWDMLMAKLKIRSWRMY